MVVQYVSMVKSKQDAKIEFDHWSGIVKKWPDGTKIELVEYNEIRHKVS